MSLFDRMFPKVPEPLVLPPMEDERPRHRFSAVGSDYETWQTLVGMFSGVTVTRAQAISIPAIKCARDAFCDNLSTLPLQCFNAAGDKLDRPLLTQPEKYSGVVRSYSLSHLIDDLFFYAESLWRVRERDYYGFPTVVQRIEHGMWNIDDKGVIRSGEDVIQPYDAIIFRSGNDPLISAGASTVRALMMLEASANRYIERPEMMEYFQPTDGQTPDDEEVRDFISDWIANRVNGVTGWIPGGVERHDVKRLTPEELQLIGAREWSVAEVARLTGISPVWLALNITSRTYLNGQDEKRAFVEGPASKYIHAIEERLSLNDVTPNGQYVKFNMNAYLRPDTKERYETYAIGLTNGFLTVDEVRALEDRGPING